MQVPARIADPDMRRRDERSADRAHHTSAPDPLHDTTGNVTNGDVGEHCRGATRDRAPCALRDRCLRTPATTVVRNVAFLRGRVSPEAEPSPTETHTMRMQQRLDAPAGREPYGQRVATVEPVFAKVRYDKRLDRFTWRGRATVTGPWLLCCLVHNIEKRTHAGDAA